MTVNFPASSQTNYAAERDSAVERLRRQIECYEPEIIQYIKMLGNSGHIVADGVRVMRIASQFVRSFSRCSINSIDACFCATTIPAVVEEFDGVRVGLSPATYTPYINILRVW